MTLLALRLLLGGWASKVWAFLCHRSFWQLVCMGCAVVIVVQHFELVHARSEAGRWHKQFDAEHAELKRLVSESKAQQQQVTKTVDHYITITKPVIEKEVRTIEAAPLPGNCKTPKEVLDADV